jgi:hypothetical protein
VHCYALRGHFPLLARAFRAYLAAARALTFARRMVAEVHRRFVGCVRIHVSGDFFSAAYVRAWIAIVRACPATRFFAYTRSWRVADMTGPLAELARCRNVRLWYSCDRDTGIPARVPRRVRLAWMMTSTDDLPPRADLVFRVHRLRRKPLKRIGLALVCPVENGATGHQTDCGRCRLCLA